MNVCIWDILDNKQPLKFTHSQHTEFVLGLDFSLYNERLLK